MIVREDPSLMCVCHTTVKSVKRIFTPPHNGNPIQQKTNTKTQIQKHKYKNTITKTQLQKTQIQKKQIQKHKYKTQIQKYK